MQFHHFPMSYTFKLFFIFIICFLPCFIVLLCEVLLFLFCHQSPHLSVIVCIGFSLYPHHCPFTCSLFIHLQCFVYFDLLNMVVGIKNDGDWIDGAQCRRKLLSYSCGGCSCYIKNFNFLSCKIEICVNFWWTKLKINKKVQPQMRPNKQLILNYSSLTFLLENITSETIDSS